MTKQSEVIGMTREEILNMSTDQLAKAVAVHVMGWEWCEPTVIGNAVSSGYWWSLSLEEPVSDWNPGEDISAAWEVITKMKERNWWIVLSAEDKEWNAMFFWDPHQQAYECDAETAPEAICKAALLAVLEG